MYEDVARDTNRGHTVRAVSESFTQSKDAGFKVVSHMMPDLPNVDLERDIEQFIEICTNVSSDMFLAIFILLQDSLPCTHTFFRLRNDWEAHEITDGQKTISNFIEPPRYTKYLSPIRSLESKFGNL